MAQKFYVVWAGRKTGVFTDWATTQAQVHGFPSARFKAFNTRAEAEQAYQAGPSTAAPVRKPKPARQPTAEGPSNYDVRIYCDGACEPNPGHAGSGIAIYRDGQLAELWYGLHRPDGTNNTAELQALHHALQFAQQAIAAGRTVQVLSDSRYAINCISQWAEGWERNGWRRAGGEIKNLEIIQSAYRLYREIRDQVQLTHVLGHAGTEGNELADRMAMYAVITREPALRPFEPLDVKQVLRMRPG